MTNEREPMGPWQRSLPLFVAALALLVLVSGCADPAPSPPNIVFINVDDLGWTDLSCQGSDFYETPHIDELASQGMRFTDAYAPASNCAPSRACVLTGQYTPRHQVYTVARSDRGPATARKLIPTKTKLHIEDDNLTMAHGLRAAGYATASIGKWHISPDPEQNGFESNIAGGAFGGPSRGGYASPYDYPNCTAEEAGEYLTDRLTNEAIDFVRDHADGPFFLYLPYYTVHSPLESKPELRAKYDAKKVSGDDTAAHGKPSYAGMIESLDQNVGRLLEALEELGLADNTVVLFTSDNGALWETSKQWPLRAGKGSYYEGGIRAPLFVRWPGVIPAGTSSAVPVSGIDFYPTLLDIAGAPLPPNKPIDGVSLVPLLKQTAEMTDRPLFWHFPIYLQGIVKQGPVETRDRLFRTRPGSVVRRGDWKLHEYFENSEFELYNLIDDIGEKHNLAQDEPQKLAELQELLLTWREHIGAPVPSELNPAFEG
ncbi:MAG: arylsulfatase A-like enzyme [Pseudohongiellaceae bacterium]|jgi:arylsulfatase A-like enzyme